MAKNEKIAYHYDDKGYYTGEINRQLDPLTSEKEGRSVYLTPGDSTLVKPPKEKEGFNRKWNKESLAWEYEAKPKKEEQTLYEPTEEELLLQQINKKKWDLSQTDYKAVKFAEGLISAEDYAPIKAERQAMRDEINALQAQLDALKEADK